jgi:hypothetical protein
VVDIAPANGAYFSIDGGVTSINTYNGTGGGDLSDWFGTTVDPYNHGIPIGQKLAESPGDITLMDVIGYDLVPEPSSLTLLAVGLSGLLAANRWWPKQRRRSRPGC